MPALETLVFLWLLGAARTDSIVNRPIDGVLIARYATLTSVTLTSLSRHAGVPIVMELLPDAVVPELPIEHEKVLTGLTVKEALDTLVEIDKRYYWVESRSVIVVRPTKAWGDRKHFLNTRIDDFSVEDRDPNDVMHALGMLYRDGRLELPSVPRALWIPLTFSIRRGTVLDVLLEVARVGNINWEVRYDDPDRMFGPVHIWWSNLEKERGGGMALPVSVPRWLLAR